MMKLSTCVIFVSILHMCYGKKNCCHQRNKWLLTYLTSLIERVFQLRMRLCRPEAILTFPVSVFTILPEGHEVDTHVYSSCIDK